MADRRDPGLGTPTVQKRGTAPGNPARWIIGLVALIVLILALGWLWRYPGGDLDGGADVEPVVPADQGAAPPPAEGTTGTLAPAAPVQQ